MRKRFWTTDWFAGVALTLLFLALFLMGNRPAWVETIERAAYDFGARTSTRDPGSQIAVVAIDDNSISNIGRWPWPRKIHAEMVEKLAAAGAKVIASTVLYTEPQVDPGLERINRLLELYKQRGLDGSSDVAVADLGKELAAAKTDLDYDQTLATAIEKAGNVVMASLFELGEPLGNPDNPTPAFMEKNAIEDANIAAGAVEGFDAFPARQIFTPIESLGSRASAIGHVNQWQDADGGIRTDLLAVNYYNRYYPSMALAVAARTLNLGSGDIRLVKGESVQVGKLEIRTDQISRMYTFFYNNKPSGEPAFQVDSFYDVYSGKIPPSKYAGKTVLIGASAFGVGDSFHTPVAEMPPVLILAHSVASILNENFFVVPGWAIWVEILLFLLVGAYLAYLLPRLKAGHAAIATAGLLLALLALSFFSMKSGNWLQTMLAAVLLVCGHLLLTTKRFLVTERGKLKADTESAESNRMLGLAFQQQGQYDMAFEKFRKCPLEDSMMDPLYNLALDFERKRQFAKAYSVYQYMSGHDPKFRDLETRLARSKQMEDTILLGGANPHPGGTLLLEDGSVQKPMLGRYQVEKELGKGAMGIVYLGRDPKINRVVAIKTLALSQEFDADELVEVKQRFFREAETAGRLQHPNIVTIYDAGEEHDLAYIAMEFLTGHDLTRYTKDEALLPVPLVMGIIYKSALALDYAHGQNVVHRDIKPANIMYDPQAKSIKLTDFGIARITDSSKTKTGMVLGTPSYMSPEQLAGRKIDGRSDLFSLGVTFYQLLCGRLPFRGDSMATLMYKIANEPHTDILEARPELGRTKPCLQTIINKALEKDVAQRYQTGGEFARDLQACAQKKSS
ncbi:MAG: Serine/threonine-protein kinase PknD [Gammaproteobacteria bacterium]|nr:Serine/threonine-protein kinase PknD [Gammaproteobacteria bacterium]